MRDKIFIFDIASDPAQPRRILTVWGRGYKLSIGADGKEDAA